MTLDRRTLLIGGGTGVGLVVAWALWPRVYPGNLVANPGETVFGAWLKIGRDGHVTVAVPQAEHGQGVYTTLPQVVADELGADWRTVGVEAAPPNPLYANTLALDELLEGVLARVPVNLRQRVAGATVTGGSTSMRMWEAPCRRAGAGARALLCKVAAGDWGVDWAQCSVDAGFVVHGKRRVRFAALAERAAAETLPEPLPIGGQGAGKLSGVSVPRIDAPSKVDGSANFAGDVRLADMVHARVRSGPVGSGRLLPGDRAAADAVAGVSSIVEGGDWIAAAATTGWAAERALDALAPRFETHGSVNDATIAAAVGAGLRAPGFAMVEEGVPGNGRTVAAEYRVAAGVPAAIETPSAVASVRDGRAEIWLPTQAPGYAARVVAEALGMDVEAVTIHPMLIGGGFGEALEAEVAAQAAVIAAKLRRPVNLVWARNEATRGGPVRAPAAARMTARLALNGAILGWRARIAAPSTGAALARQLLGGTATEAALVRRQGDAYAVAGARPPYRLPAVAVYHHPVELALRTGHLRGGSHVATCFFGECFLDELARAGSNEPVSFRIGMLGGNPRLAQCLSTAAALGGWEGGAPGSGQGVACHSFRGSHMAVMAEVHEEAGRIIVDRLVAAVDCGQMIHPDIVRQQIEGGLIVGLAGALGAATGYARGLPTARGMSGLSLPRLTDTPDITVELIRSDEAPGGVGELGVPAVAPAIANALFAATGRRRRTLPIGG